MSLLGIGIGGAVCLQCGEIAVGVGGKNIRNLKFAKPGTGDSFWKSNEINMFQFQVKFLRGSHHGHKCCLLASIMFFFRAGDYFRYHQLRKIKMEGIMRQFEIMKPPEAAN